MSRLATVANPDNVGGKLEMLWVVGLNPLPPSREPRWGQGHNSPRRVAGRGVLGGANMGRVGVNGSRAAARRAKSLMGFDGELLVVGERFAVWCVCGAYGRWDMYDVVRCGDVVRFVDGAGFAGAGVVAARVVSCGWWVCAADVVRVLVRFADGAGEWVPATWCRLA